MKQIIASFAIALVLLGCSGTDSSEVAVQTTTTTEPPAATTTAAPTTTTTAAPTTTTTTVPVKRWVWEESIEYNVNYLIGAPIDPAMADDVNEIDRLLDIAGYSVDEHYWASYIASADIACTTIEVFYDVAIEENWNKWEAAEGIELWAETMNEAVQAQPGLRAISDDEAIAIKMVGLYAIGCAWIWDFFIEFIDS
jgi:hypothetical protein